MRETNPDCQEIVRRYEADNEDFGTTVTSLWNKLDMPLEHPYAEIENNDGADLNHLATLAVGSIRRWAETIN